jgi:hypothetical protein
MAALHHLRPFGTGIAEAEGDTASALLAAMEADAASQMEIYDR